MNNQNFHQLYNHQSANGPTAEQVATFQKQQQMFLQQQQQYMLQQQQLQKQMMREEQRNRLKNMNVKSMGMSTFQQHTSMQQQPVNNQTLGNSYYQPPSSFPANQQYSHSPISHSQNFMQASLQGQEKGMTGESAQSFTSLQQIGNVQPMTSLYPPQPIAPVQNVTPVFSTYASTMPHMNSTSSYSPGMWNDSKSHVVPHDNHQNSLAVSTGSGFGDSFVNNSTADASYVKYNTRSLTGPFESNDKPPGNLSRSDSDEFGDFTSTSGSFSQLQNSDGAPKDIDIFKSTTSTNSGTYHSTDFGLLSIAPSSSAQDDTYSKFDGQNNFQNLSSTGHNSALTNSSKVPWQKDSLSNCMLPVSTPADRMDLSSVVQSSFLDQLPVTQNHAISSQHDRSSVQSIDDGKDDAMDDFDDFQTAAPEITSSVSSSKEATLSKQTELSHQGYVPGSLTNENADVVYSVAIFSNPIKVDSTPKSDISEFDKLITKSLSGKPTKSSVKSLFKPAQKPSIPSMKSSVTPSEKAADWGSLNLGDVFQIPAQENDDFGEFASKSPKFEVTPQKDTSDILDSTFDTKSTLSKAQESSSNDLFSLFSSPKQSSNYDKVPYISEGTLDLSDTKVGITDLLGITKIAEAKPAKKRNPITNLFSDSECNKSVVESSGIDWTGFTSSQSSTSPNLTEPVAMIDNSSSSSSLNMNKIPSLYKDIIEYCNTPSGIIDVGRVYEVMLTDKFKVVALQPLMSQCKMMGCPTAKDLVDLIGIVGLKQKGFPAPSKYELNYNKLSLPSVNISVLKKMKTNKKIDESDQPTLLSFVNQDTKKSDSSFAPVFDFGTSSTKDLSSAPFAGESKNVTDVLANNDDDDWGDFGSFPDPAEKSKFSWDSNQFSNDKPLAQNNPVLDLFQESVQVNLPPQSHAGSIQKSKTKVPLVLDEPPPLSDDDDEDWADFAHPAHKWDIDPDKIEEQAVNNAASKNRWGTISTSCEKEYQDEDCHDKDYSHVPVELNSSKSPNFFAADFSVSSPLKIEQEKSSDLNQVNEPISLVSAQIADDSVLNEAPLDTDKSDLMTEEVVSKTRKDIDKLASPENQTGDFVSPFADFADESKNSFVNVFGNAIEPFPSGMSASNFDSPFADFIDSSSITHTESADFADFTASSDLPDIKIPDAKNLETEFAEFDSGDIAEEDEFSDFCGMDENTDMAKDAVSESLKLTNLPKKDLDGFWNDMVDTLGSNVQSEPVFDLEDQHPTKPNVQADVNSLVPSAICQPVSYDALKGESFDNEEDRIGAWSKCLSMILTILIQCQNLFGTSQEPSIKHEVVNSEKGKMYLDCCTEVFRVACRISIAGAADDGIVEIFKEIKHTWTLISEMLDDSIDLPNIRDFHIRSDKSEDEFSERNCGVCVLDTGVENKTSKLKYNGVFYHVTCANFWVNAVNPLLPNLNCQFENSLL